ncbi:MAG TPA: hypothetical protein VH370_23510 [Humisphaera sp.]|jgi:copper chaperone CopZ|nr:hypothetical protein [Humisphaera sp.]
MYRTALRVFGLLAPMALSSIALADATATVEKTHLCCNNCVKGVNEAVAKVDGAKATCDQKGGKITITAKDEASAQKAVDALLAAGYFGKVTGATVKDDSGAKAGKVQTATVSDIHNCCNKCTTSINDTIKKVPGASAVVASKATSFPVAGDFDETKLVQEFNDAGFHVKVK